MKIVLAALAAIALAAPTAANAAIATFNGGNYIQSGSVTNNSGLNLVGVVIDLSNDAGAPAPGTAIWDSNGGAYLGGGTASDFAPDGNHFFVISFLGLLIVDGDNFNYSGLDLDGYLGGNSFGGGVGALFDGSEFVRLIFEGGATATAFFSSGANVDNGVRLSFENFDGVNEIPLPAALPMFLAAIAGGGLLRRRRRA